jgi:CubicO group peptidase (beta-lactamase class C family)
MSVSRWQYSGEEIFLLQRVVERIVGVPIGLYMKEKVLRTFGITASISLGARVCKLGRRRVTIDARTYSSARARFMRSATTR